MAVSSLAIQMNSVLIQAMSGITLRFTPANCRRSRSWVMPHFVNRSL
jgi:hypothetical protein